MLGRTANGLYWMFRYIERAENSARLIDAGLRMALTRSGATEGDWDGVLQSAGVRELYDEVHE
ncbi:MAG: alpha-E domain-containing protein, partial [Ensifer adhaerens]